jgi:hypothetical protein
VSGCWRTAARSLWSALETFQLVLTELVMDDGCVECARGALLLWSSLINWPIRSEDLRLSVTTTWHFRRSIRNYPQRALPPALITKAKATRELKRRRSFLRTQPWSCAWNFHFSLSLTRSNVRWFARAWTFSGPNGSQHLYLFWLLSHLITELESFLGAHVSRRP